MIIKYQFANGEISELEVTDEMGAVILDLDRVEYNINHKEARRHTTLNNGFDDAEWLAVEDLDLEAIFADESDAERLQKALSQLNPKQRELIKSIYFDGISVSDFAVMEGVSQPAISQRLETAIKK